MFRWPSSRPRSPGCWVRGTRHPRRRDVGGGRDRGRSERRPAARDAGAHRQRASDHRWKPSDRGRRPLRPHPRRRPDSHREVRGRGEPPRGRLHRADRDLLAVRGRRAVGSDEQRRRGGGPPGGSFRAIELAMAEAGIGPDDEVLFRVSRRAGWSRPVAASGDWKVVGLETYGAPTGNIPLPAGISGMAVRNTDDLVPALGGPQPASGHADRAARRSARAWRSPTTRRCRRISAAPTRRPRRRSTTRPPPQVRAEPRARRDPARLPRPAGRPGDLMTYRASATR